MRDVSAAISRRGLLRLGAAGAFGLLGASALSGCATAGERPDYILASDPEIGETEATRPHTGRTVHHVLRAQSATIAVTPGQYVGTWGYSEDVTLAALGPTLRARRGDRLLVDVDNTLTEETSVHWHGLRIRNDMDGAPPDTQKPIPSGGQFRYNFVLPDHGTHWYHSHTGVQADRAMFGALIVEDPDDTSGADTDLVLVIDDWVDGFGATPEEVLAALDPVGTGGHAHGGIAAAPPEVTAAALALVTQGVGNSAVLGGPTQHINYPLHLINGRSPEDPQRHTVPAGSRVRLRVINAAAETPYRVALAGHRVTVIATDGFDAEPFETDSVLIAPAQRVDLLVDLTSGSWPFVARVEGRDGAALAVIATHDAAGASPSGAQATQIPELDGQLATDADLHPHDSTRLSERVPDQLWRLELLESPEGFMWGVAGEDAANMRPRIGERIRIEVANPTSMWHPVHLHGHTFASRTHNGLRRDTVAVLPGETAVLDFDADNPGRWMIHCHNAYHFVAGMSAPIRYVR